MLKCDVILHYVTHIPLFWENERKSFNIEF